MIKLKASINLRRFILVNLCFLFACTTFAAAVTDESITYQGKKYGSSYFFPISGEVSGQAAPGVESVLINGQPVKIDSNLNYTGWAYLAQGQKYLTIEIHYKGLRLIKKYLVIRHPQAPKTFVIRMPKEELTELIAKKIPTEEVKPVAEKKVAPAAPPRRVAKRPVKVKVYQAKAVPLSEEVASQLVANTRSFEALVKKSKIPAGKSPWQRFVDWLSGGIFGRRAEKAAYLPNQKAIEQTVIAKATIIIEKNTQRVIEEKVEERVQQLLPTAEAIRLLRGEAQLILKEIAPRVLEKEVDKIMARDVPRGEGRKIIEREISRIVAREIPVILDREVNRIVNLNLPSAEVIRIASGMIRARVVAVLSKDTIWKMARSEVKKKVMSDLDRDLPQILREEIARRLEEKEKIKPIKTPRLPEGNAFDYVFELEPGKILLVKVEAGKYRGFLYSTDDRSISALQELSYQELKDLLGKSKHLTQ